MEHDRHDAWHQPQHDAGWKARLEKRGVAAILGDSRGHPAVFLVGWVLLVVCWITKKSPLRTR